MNTDSAVLTGTHHSATARPCQDYGLAHCDENGAWVVVSDGCSSGGDTDLGARILARAVHQVLSEQSALVQTAWLEENVCAKAAGALDSHRVSDLLATLVVAQVRDGTVRVSFFGDGVAVLRHTDGTLTRVQVTYSDNAPGYLAYTFAPGLAQAWQAQYPGQQRTCRIQKLSAQGDVLEQQVIQAEACLTGLSLNWDIQADAIGCVLVATDGLDTAGTAPEKAAAQVADIKGSVGEFLKRRMGKLARLWGKQNGFPDDDLAVSAVWISQESAHG